MCRALSFRYQTNNRFYTKPRYNRDFLHTRKSGGRLVKKFRNSVGVAGDSVDTPADPRTVADNDSGGGATPPRTHKEN